MLAPFATDDDVAALLQVAVGDLPAGVSVLLDVASGVIASEFPLTASVDDVTAEVRAACMQMVARAITNPQGVQQKTIDNFTVVYATGGAVALGLELTDEERRWLSKWRTTAGTIKITSPYVAELGG